MIASRVSSARDLIRCRLCSRTPESWERGVQVAPYTTANLQNGNVLVQIPIVSWSGLGPAVDVSFFYNTADGVWRWSYSDTLIEEPLTGDMIWTRPDGRQIRFFLIPGNIWEAESGYYMDLEETIPSSTVWTITFKDQSTMTFDENNEGRLTAITDAAGNEVTVVAGANSLHVTDATTNREFHIDPELVCPPGQICQDPNEAFIVTEDNLSLQSGPRTWVLRFDATDNLIRSITDPMNFKIGLSYSPQTGRLIAISEKYEIPPPGESPTIRSYWFEQDAAGRLTSVTDPTVALPSPITHTQSFAYAINGSGNPETTYVNRRGTSVAYEYSSPNGVPNLRQVNDGDKWTVFTWDDSRNLVQRSHQAGGTWRWTYDGNGNVISEQNPLAYMDSWTYDTLNNVLGYRDAAGNIWDFDYATTVDPTALTTVTLPDINGQSVSDTINITYHIDGGDNGLVESVTDANGVVTSFSYDIYGQLAKEIEGEIGDDRVVVLHDFDAVSRNLRSYRQGACGSQSTAPADGATGGNTYNLNDQITMNTCVVSAGFAGSCAGATVMPEPQGMVDYNQHMPTAEYDPAGRPTFIEGSIEPGGEGSKIVTVKMEYDEVGRPTLVERISGEPCDGIVVSRKYTFEYDTPNGITIENTPTMWIHTNTDILGRVSRVRGCLDASCESVAYQADYTYVANRDLVETITYANGTSTAYEYDLLGRVTRIAHSVGVMAPFLSLDYFYDARGLITQIIEYDGQATNSTGFLYDARRRLIHEARTGTSPYDLTYAYDPGGNRIQKIDEPNDLITDYYYDVDPNVPATSHLNRLMWYETRDRYEALIEHVEYEYDAGDDAAGNVSQIIKMKPDPVFPGLDPRNPDAMDVLGYHFMYTKSAEVRIVTVRQWRATADGAGGYTHVADPDPNTVGGIPTRIIKMREFRGSGRTRHMMRDRIDAATPDHSTEVWTDYRQDLPTGDYTVDCKDTVDPAKETRHYDPGLAEVDDPYGAATVAYTHTNHLGTTGARTDDVPAAFEQPVYTAFGERVNSDGTFGASPANALSTRYGYVGKEGYETLDDADWGLWDRGLDLLGNPILEPVEFPFIHTGARWYDPTTGRFLQRDPIGSDGGLNVYEYVDSSPLGSTDPTGWDRFYAREHGHSSVWFPRKDGGYDVYDFGPKGGAWAAAFGGPGNVNKARNGGPLPAGAKRHKSSASEDAADQSEMDQQVIVPPYFQAAGLGAAYNCIGWAQYWASKRDPKPKPRARVMGIPCLVAGTLVLADDELVPIEKIQTGSRVSTWDFDSRTVTESEVLFAGQTGRAHVIVEITIDDGETFRSTADHPFWTNNRGWTEAAELTKDDVLLSTRGQAVRIIRVERIHYLKPVPVFDIRVRVHRWFFIGRRGILVHNT
jgi:YD repeat-containing protein